MNWVQNVVTPIYTPPSDGMLVHAGLAPTQPPGGGTPTCKWWEWSNEGKTQDPKKSLSLPTLPKKSLDQK